MDLHRVVSTEINKGKDVTPTNAEFAFSVPSITKSFLASQCCYEIRTTASLHFIVSGSNQGQVAPIYIAFGSGIC